MSITQLSEGIAEQDIEGLIFKENGVWVGVFDVMGEKSRCRIDFCPWCGQELKRNTLGHNH